MCHLLKTCKRQCDGVSLEGCLRCSMLHVSILIFFKYTCTIIVRIFACLGTSVLQC